MSFGGTHVSRHSFALRSAPPITNSTLRPQHNGRHIGSITTEAGCVLQEISAARIEVQSSRACYRMQASLERDQMSILRVDRAWRIGLAAVIEETSGHKSYWALAHPPGKADFHHSDSFALEFSWRIATMKFGIDRLITDPALRAP